MTVGKMVWILVLLALILALAGTAFSPPPFEPVKKKNLDVMNPKVIPHSTEGRKDCLSCHRDGLKPPIVTHPERVNCVQCHVESQTR